MAEEFKHLVRIANTDFKGTTEIAIGMSKVKGIGYSLARALLHIAGISHTEKAGEMSDANLKKLEALIKAPQNTQVPKWMLNRRKDLETGEDTHFIGNDLVFTQQNDIKLMRRLKTYRGVRHALKLPSRGQRTRSNFRPNKGKVTGVKTAGKKRG